MGRTDAEKPAMARRTADRPASIGAEGEVCPFDTAAAEPEDEPPGIRSAAAPFTGVPKWAFFPLSEKASSSVIVLPTNRAPASSRLERLVPCRSSPPTWRAHRRAAARRVPCDVEEILYGECQPGQRSRCRHSAPARPDKA